jgi:hypothetical protein
VLGQGLSKSRQISGIRCWDGNQKLDRSARSSAGMEIKNLTGQRDWVLGQGLSKTRHVSKIGCWDGNQKLDRSTTSAGAAMPETQDVWDECRDRNIKNSGCM